MPRLVAGWSSFGLSLNVRFDLKLLSRSKLIEMCSLFSKWPSDFEADARLSSASCWDDRLLGTACVVVTSQTGRFHVLVGDLSRVAGCFKDCFLPSRGASISPRVLSSPTDSCPPASRPSWRFERDNADSLSIRDSASNRALSHSSSPSAVQSELFEVCRTRRSPCRLE